MGEESKCPITHKAHTAGNGTTNQDWWPNQLNLEYLAPAFSQVQSDG